MKYLCNVAFMLFLMKAALLPLCAQPLQQAPPMPSPSMDMRADVPAETGSCGSLQERSAQLVAQRKYAAATEVLQQALSICPNQVRVLLVLAKAQMLSRQFDAALSSLRLLLADDPANIAALITQGEVFYLRDEDPKAELSLKQAIHLAPNDAEPHYWLGRIYYSDSRVHEAKEQFHEALKVDPSAYKAYDGLALCYENTNDVRMTVQTFMEGIAFVYKGYPDYDVIYADFAEFLLKYGENQKAFSMAAEAAVRNPREPRNFLLAGKALEEDGKLLESLPWLEQSAKLDPTYPAPHYFLTRVYRKMGKMDASANEAAKCRELSAHAPQVRR